MKRVISGLLSLSLVVGAVSLAELMPQLTDISAISASAETDIWGREYKTYGDFRYQIKSDTTISIIGFDTSKDTAVIPQKIEGRPVTEIGYDAFFQAYYLTSLTMPDTITTIGKEAFYQCGALSSIKLSSKLKSIGNNAFDHCTSLKSINIPSTVTSIGESAFQYSGLESIALPDSVKSIKSKAFYCMPDLVSAVMPTNVDEFGTWVFAFSENLQTATLPSNLTKIPDRTFYQCYALKKFNLPSNVTSIGSYSLYYCKNLESITIPKKVTEISESAFRGCSSLNSVSLSEGLKTIGTWAFMSCTSLKTLIIPKSVSKIGSDCFYNCNDLTLQLFMNSYAVDHALTNNVDFTTIYIADVNNSFKASPASDSSVVLSWNKVNDAEGYVIYKYNQKWEKINKTAANVSSYTVSGLSSGTEHKFAIRAYKTVIGNEVLSLEYPTASTVTYLPKVSGFRSASSSENAVKLTWNKISGATGYVVYRANSGKWVKVGVVKTNLFTDSKLRTGTSYRYAVKAYKTVNGKNVYSVSYPTLWTSTNPAAVNFKLTAGSKKAVVKWSKVTGATGYKIYYKTSKNGKWIGLKTTNNKTTSYTKTGLAKGKTYWFTVKAYRTANGKTYNGKFYTKSVVVK